MNDRARIPEKSSSTGAVIDLAFLRRLSRCGRCFFGAVRVRSARLTGSRGLARRGHGSPAIERQLLKQAAMFISPMLDTDGCSDETCQQRTGRHEEDGCWPALEKS